jgi:sulfate transporter 4
MVIPQGMSYAQNLAFLPQVYGLYGAFVPCLIYGALGSSRHVSVGPVAVTSLLLGSGLTGIFGEFQINPSDPYDAYQVDLQDRFNRGAIQISFLAGLMYTAIGLFRLGWIVNFLSQAVISGFMTGAASIIVCTQLKYITGQYYLPRTDTVGASLKVMFDNMQLFRYPEFGMVRQLSLLVCLNDQRPATDQSPIATDNPNLKKPFK